MKQKVENYLNKLNKYQPGFLVQRFIEFPAPWVPYKSEQYYDYLKEYGEPNHREILKNEVVIDVDSENSKEGKKHGDLVDAKLSSQNICFKRYRSGGDGEHFHLIFTSIPNIIEDEYLISRVKYILIEFLLGKELINPEGINSHICMANKKLIQIEHQLHRKGGIKKLIKGNLVDNELPSKFYGFLNDKILARKKIINVINTIPEPDNLNCIKFIQGEKINGYNYFNLSRVNYRAMFLIISYFKRKYNDENKVYDKSIKWLNSLPLNMRRASISTVNKNILKKTCKLSNGSVSCMYRMDLLEELNMEKVCDGCPYNKK